MYFAYCFTIQINICDLGNFYNLIGLDCLEKDFLTDVSRIQFLLPEPSNITSKPLILITTSLPLKFGYENQKDHLPKRRKILGYQSS